MTMELEDRSETSKKTVQDYYNAKYLVKTVVPLVDNPYYKSYIFSHDEFLKFYLDDLQECAQFIVSVDVLL